MQRKKEERKFKTREEKKRTTKKVLNGEKENSK